MKRIFQCLMAMLAGILLIHSTALACWMYLSIEEMENEADLIIIGRYEGRVKEHVDRQGHGHRYWTIETEVSLKGENQDKIEVVTGGSSSARVHVSTDYALTDFAEEYMLLFLSENEDGRYEPVTPRGIVRFLSEKNGSVLNAYEIESPQHAEETDEILGCVNRWIEARSVEEANQSERPIFRNEDSGIDGVKELEENTGGHKEDAVIKIAAASFPVLGLILIAVGRKRKIKR